MAGAGYMPHPEHGVHISARRNSNRSFSHWGMFKVPSEFVQIRMIDCGQINDELISTFICNGDIVKSRFTADRDIWRLRGVRNIADARVDADMATICRAWDLDSESIKVVS